VIADGPWKEPTFADSTEGDDIDGEDLAIRRAAVEALGPYNGSVVVVDPNTGRILSMVNQKLALGAGFQPCSTIKVSVALAGLNEKAIQAEQTLFDGLSLSLFGVTSDPADAARPELAPSPGLRHFADLDGQISRRFGVAPRDGALAIAARIASFNMSRCVVTRWPAPTAFSRIIRK